MARWPPVPLRGGGREGSGSGPSAPALGPVPFLSPPFPSVPRGRGAALTPLGDPIARCTARVSPSRGAGSPPRLTEGSRGGGCPLCRCLRVSPFSGGVSCPFCRCLGVSPPSGVSRVPVFRGVPVFGVSPVPVFAAPGVSLPRGSRSGSRSPWVHTQTCSSKGYGGEVVLFPASQRDICCLQCRLVGGSRGIPTGCKAELAVPLLLFVFSLQQPLLHFP